MARISYFDETEHPEQSGLVEKLRALSRPGAGARG